MSHKLWLILLELHSKYAKYADLYDHQVKRCKKRYVSNKWVVKIWFPENFDYSKPMIPRRYITEDIITPPNPNPIYGYHLSDIESYWSNIPPKLSLQFTNFMGSRSNDPEPDSIDQTTWSDVQVQLVRLTCSSTSSWTCSTSVRGCPPTTVRGY